MPLAIAEISCCCRFVLVVVGVFVYVIVLVSFMWKSVLLGRVTIKTGGVVKHFPVSVIVEEENAHNHLTTPLFFFFFFLSFFCSVWVKLELTGTGAGFDFVTMDSPAFSASLFSSTQPAHVASGRIVPNTAFRVANITSLCIVAGTTPYNRITSLLGWS